ncbi:purple acid phosphatase family protein [Desulfotomaculum copahuensis]|uniref:Calcineurin-like phosphoesterase domain-containing protein n=1 Tax=Desulfotomaculum copahuensis TaxID=1838280 RepID=A0A1B7LHP2_9FIRM|nr:metallophosphoesterase family protein [Desulfotomaculum copahuensis]OAT85812.1 hypothetical protein A6M21_04840 [Desulfotomaculum copahuensis]
MTACIEHRFPGFTSGTMISNEELCTTGSDHAVITWVTSQPCPVITVYIGEDPAQLTGMTAVSNSRYHQVELTGLKPGTQYWYQVESGGARGPLNLFQTLPVPEGMYLFSFAVISDTHIPAGNILDDANKLYFGKLSEYADVLMAQSITDVKKRKVDLVVFTGDLTDTARRTQYLKLRNQLLPRLGDTPRYLCIGNHDKFTNYGGVGERGFTEYLTGGKPACQSAVFGERQFVMLDSCRQNDNWGHLDDGQLCWLESVLGMNGGRPVFIFLHHPCNGFDLWFGLKNHRDFKKIIKRYPSVQGVFCGHMHRNRVTTDRLIAGYVPFVEIPATVQFPCAYGVIKVYEQGFEYSSYKVGRLDLSEMSRERFILKNGGKAIFSRYSFGGMADRSFALYNGRMYRPKLYELSVTLEDQKAVKLFTDAQLHDGASLAPFEPGRTRVLLGRFQSLRAARLMQKQKLSLYNVNIQIKEEGSHESSITIKE